MKIKILLFVLVLSMALNGYLMFVCVDDGTALTDIRSKNDDLRERRQFALRVINHRWSGSSVEDLESLAREFEAEGVIVKRYDDFWELHDFIFAIGNGRVLEVGDFDSPLSDADEKSM
ncbi:MAG: hypothetical protein AAF481_00785 [Acidobacteriota bacterium]